MAFISGCEKEPTATFEFEKTEVNIGEPVLMKNQSLDAETFEWDFGDGSKQTEKTTSHLYKKSGSYKVTLTAISKSGDKKNTITKEIVVRSPAKNIAGNYDVNESRTSTRVGSGNLKYTMTINTIDDYTVKLNNLGKTHDGIIATVDGNKLIFQKQDGIVTNNYGGATYTFWSGSGVITPDGIDLTYSYDDINYALAIGIVDAKVYCIKIR